MNVVKFQPNQRSFLKSIREIARKTSMVNLYDDKIPEHVSVSDIWRTLEKGYLDKGPLFDDQRNPVGTLKYDTAGMQLYIDVSITNEDNQQYLHVLHVTDV